MLLLEADPEATKRRFLEGGGIAVNVHVVKNRTGGVGSVAFDFLPDCHHFTERGRVPSPFEIHTTSHAQEAKQASDRVIAEAISQVSKVTDG